MDNIKLKKWKNIFNNWNDNKIIEIESIEDWKIISYFFNIEFKFEDDIFIFRGHENSWLKDSLKEWDFMSTYKRQYINKYPDYKNKDFKNLNKNYMKNLKKVKKDYKEKERKLFDIMAEQQHNGKGVGTLLIDATADLNNALFFAINNIFDKLNIFDKTKTFSNKYYVTIYAIKLREENIILREKENEDEKLEKNMMSEDSEPFKVMKYQNNENRRSLTQKSWFILDNKESYKFIKIKLLYESTFYEKLKKYLFNQDITIGTLYPDTEGLYDQHMKIAPITDDLTLNNEKKEKDKAYKEIIEILIKDIENYNDSEISKNKKVYIVVIGRQYGIYKTWIETHKQITGFNNELFKSFKTKESAQKWLLNLKNYNDNNQNFITENYIKSYEDDYDIKS